MRRASRRRCGRRGRRGVAASDAPDFYAAELSLADILDEGFLAAHVRAPGAKLYAVNADGRADRDDVAAVTPTGRLLLSLTPETYRRAGVSGAPSDDGTLKRRCAVNLANKTFAPGARSEIASSRAREPWTPRARGAASESTSARTPSTTSRRR